MNKRALVAHIIAGRIITSASTHHRARDLLYGCSAASSTGLNNNGMPWHLLDDSGHLAVGVHATAAIHRQGRPVVRTWRVPLAEPGEVRNRLLPDAVPAHRGRTCQEGEQNNEADQHCKRI